MAEEINKREVLYKVPLTVQKNQIIFKNIIEKAVPIDIEVFKDGDVLKGGFSIKIVISFLGKEFHLESYNNEQAAKKRLEEMTKGLLSAEMSITIVERKDKLEVGVLSISSRSI